MNVCKIHNLPLETRWQSLAGYDGMEIAFCPQCEVAVEPAPRPSHIEVEFLKAKCLSLMAQLERAGMTEEAHARVRQTIDVLCSCSDSWKTRAEAAEAENDRLRGELKLVSQGISGIERELAEARKERNT